MYFTKLYFVLLSEIMLLVDGARWENRFKVYSIGMWQDAVMECDIGGANFTGFYKKSDIKTKITNSDRIKITKDGSIRTLEISKITEADFDTYICKDSENGTDSAALEIVVSLEPKPEDPQILLDGEPGTITLKVYGKPKPKMTWYLTRVNKSQVKIAERDTSGNMKTNVGDLYTIDDVGTLNVKKIQAADAGVYELVVKTGNGARLRKSITVKVEFKLELKTQPPKSFVRAVGQKLFIPCVWLYADTPLPTWTFTSMDGKETVIKEGVKANGLEVAKVTMESQGKYTCAAANKYGHLNVDSSLAQVIDPAAITTDFGNIIKRRLGTDYTLVCEAKGKPDPQVKLSKVNKNVLEFIKKGTRKVTKQFPKLSITDGGVYSCHADNGAKTLGNISMAETKNVTLEVFAPSEIDTKATTINIVSAIGRDYTIECRAKGYPYPKMLLLGNNKDITTEVKTENDMVTVKLVVTSAKKEHFAYKEIRCNATNAYGVDSKTIPIKQIFKAPKPTDVEIVGTVGLSEIDLKWKQVAVADKYLVLIDDLNGTIRKENSSTNFINIINLKRKTYYNITIASVNLAGVGNYSVPINFETADIIRPRAVTNIRVNDLTSQSAMIIWTSPENVDADLNPITYYMEYCMVKNYTVTSKCEKNEKKEPRLKLKGLAPETKYRVTVYAINQRKTGVRGTPFFFTTKATPPPTATTINPNNPGGLTSGEIAGIIVAIILIILIVVDLFCCFFNNCGFSHCCFETFCAAKDKKFLPVDTTEGYEAQELEEKAPNSV